MQNKFLDMDYTLDKLISILLSRSEQMEDDLKRESEIENLSIKQLQCIELITEMQNPNFSELAERLKITKPSVTAMVDKLEANGFVTRIKSDTDRRSAHIHLTSKGEIAGQLHDNLHQSISKRLTKNLTKSEKDIMVVLLNKAILSFE